MTPLSHQERKDRGMIEKHTKKIDRMRERAQEGRKEGRNSQYISRQRRDKREEMNEGMPAHVSSDTPLPHLDPL